MIDPIESKIIEWEKTDGEKYRELNHRILHLDKRLYHDYEPTLGLYSKFLNRLSKWLENTNDIEEQKTLFELVPNIFYIGREEFNVLYREAYVTNFSRWLIDQLGINFSTPNFLETINNEVIDTWFCPITDSLRINLFYHINNIPGKHDYRPDWRSLVQFGSAEKIKEYIKKKG